MKLEELLGADLYAQVKAKLDEKMQMNLIN